MDNDYRLQAKKASTEAGNLCKRRSNNNHIIQKYSQAINFYQKIVEKNQQDKREMATIYTHMAIIYFNDANYLEAGNYYSQTINQLLQLPLTDNGYRELIERYIDLADVCSHLFNPVGANEAMVNAIQAFKLIKYKAIVEQQLGDPNNNFKAFRAYYEQKTSTSSYLNSTKYKNNEQLLYDRHEENTVLDKLSAISFEPETTNAHIDNMMDQLSIANDHAHQSLFTPVPLTSQLNDGNYRAMAIEFLRLTQTHITQGSISNAIKTYQQAKEALTTIASKSNYDTRTLCAIEKQINYLKEQSAHQKQPCDEQPSLNLLQPLMQQNYHTSTSLVSTIGLFKANNQDLACSNQANNNYDDDRFCQFECEMEF